MNQDSIVHHQLKKHQQQFKGNINLPFTKKIYILFLIKIDCEKQLTACDTDKLTSQCYRSGRELIYFLRVGFSFLLYFVM